MSLLNVPSTPLPAFLLIIHCFTDTTCCPSYATDGNEVKPLCYSALEWTRPSAIWPIDSKHRLVLSMSIARTRRSTFIYFDILEHPAAASIRQQASRVPTLLNLGSSGTSPTKVSADYESVSSRTGIKETCANMDRETVVSSLLGSVSNEKRDHASHALGSRIALHLCALEKNLSFGPHMSHTLLLSHLPFTTSTSSSSFTLPSTTTPEHALQSGQHDHLQKHPVYIINLHNLPVDKQRHQESLRRENLQSGETSSRYQLWRRYQKFYFLWLHTCHYTFGHGFFLSCLSFSSTARPNCSHQFETAPYVLS